jgi:hypothetical protein
MIGNKGLPANFQTLDLHRDPLNEYRFFLAIKGPVGRELVNLDLSSIKQLRKNLELDKPIDIKSLEISSSRIGPGLLKYSHFLVNWSPANFKLDVTSDKVAFASKHDGLERKLQTQAA